MRTLAVPVVVAFLFGLVLARGGFIFAGVFLIGMSVVATAMLVSRVKRAPPGHAPIRRREW